jgi:uncharacterized protein (TIGR01777 family)
MKILITGATGLIGQKLGRRLASDGHELFVVSRNAKSAEKNLEFPARIFEGDLARAPIVINEKIDIVIHLMGESVAAGRWTNEQKKSIMDSRVLGTRNLIASLSQAPKMILSASAVGFYGDQKDQWVNEDSAPGSDFLARVCVNWEQELWNASQKFGAETKLTCLRVGVVLARSGGALEKILVPFRVGIGGPIGSGSQYMSWIHIHDLVELFAFAIQNNFVGRFNAVAPTPVTNTEFSQTLAKILGRVLAPRVPAMVLKLMLGEMSQVVLGSQRVSNEKIRKQFFEFKFVDLESALADLVLPIKGSFEVLESAQFIPQKKHEIFKYFSEAKNLEELTPETLQFQIKKMSTPQIEKGTLIDYKLKIHGVPVGWRTLIEDWVPNEKFIDTQLKGPYKVWHHTHSFEDFAGGTLISDYVRFKLPFGYFGWLLGGIFVRADVQKIFAYRREIIFKKFIKAS